MMFRSTVAAALAAGLFLTAPMAQAQTEAPPPQPGVYAGQLQVTGPTWSFSANLAGLSGPWGSATVTNTNCATPYLPGTAQAGAVIFTSTLAPGTNSAATLRAFKGSAASGTISLAPMPDRRGTNVTATLNDLEPFVQGTTLSVCLTVSPLPQMLADINIAQQFAAANNFDVTGASTAATDTFQPLIAVSGSQTAPDGTNQQWVFVFLGDVYLGTDTLVPSMAPLQLVGSPGANQLDVAYEDPAGGPPATITYTLADGVLTPSGTPPGH
jgi:hypothetical protein